MPETSIVVKSTDRYSDAIKKMSSVTKSFSKDVDKLEDTLYALNKNKITMKMDLSKAKSELKAAEKQFDLTHSAADGLKLELAQANYDNMVRNLKAVTSAARETEKAISKAENSADSGGGGTSFGKSVINALAVSGIGDAAKQILSQGANAIAGSALGDDGGSMFSSALSTAATGASAGFMVGGPAGAAIGAAIGTGVGLVSGGIQIFEKRDDAYKDWYAGLYENAGATTDTGLSSGSTIAGSREQTQMAFAQKLGGDEAANAYLDRVKAMATSTNYSYDEITGYSKLLLNTYDAEKTLGVLQTLSDASAGLNLGSSDVKMFISGLSRMRTSGKATTEYVTVAIREYCDLEAKEVAAAGGTQNNGRANDASSSRKTQSYTIVSGDTLSVICRRYYGKSSAKYYNALAKYNGIKNPHLIYPGVTIQVPSETVLLGGSA